MGKPGTFLSPGVAEGQIQVTNWTTATTQEGSLALLSSEYLLPYFLSSTPVWLIKHNFLVKLKASRIDLIHFQAFCKEKSLSLNMLVCMCSQTQANSFFPVLSLCQVRLPATVTWFPKLKSVAGLVAGKTSSLCYSFFIRAWEISHFRKIIQKVWLILGNATVWCSFSSTFCLLLSTVCFVEEKKIVFNFKNVKTRNTSINSFAAFQGPISAPIFLWASVSFSLSYWGLAAGCNVITVHCNQDNPVSNEKDSIDQREVAKWKFEKH